MDRGLGLFAGLNVLPKAAWFSSYSHRVTRKMNLSFLRSLHKLWQKNALLSETTNLGCTAVPYWGDDKAFASILAVIAHDPDSGSKVLAELEGLPDSVWKQIRVMTGTGKKRSLKVYDQKIFLRDYGKEIRQVAIADSGKIKPALIITNDAELAQVGMVGRKNYI